MTMKESKSELRQCSCGEIARGFTVQHVWCGANSAENIGVVFCNICGDAEPFKFFSYGKDNGAARAMAAWNKGPTK